MIWRLSHKKDPRAASMADRHYSRQSVGAVQFHPPGKSVVLVCDGAFWVSLFQQYVDHAFPGAWQCSAFRNEGAGLSSELIRDAVAATRWFWPEVPPQGMVTFVDRSKVRHKRDPGRCFVKAGFRRDGETAKGLVVLRLDPANFPDPAMPLDATPRLFE